MGVTFLLVRYYYVIVAMIKGVGLRKNSIDVSDVTLHSVSGAFLQAHDPLRRSVIINAIDDPILGVLYSCGEALLRRNHLHPLSFATTAVGASGDKLVLGVYHRRWDAIEEQLIEASDSEVRLSPVAIISAKKWSSVRNCLETPPLEPSPTPTVGHFSQMAMINFNGNFDEI